MRRKNHIKQTIAATVGVRFFLLRVIGKIHKTAVVIV